MLSVKIVIAYQQTIMIYESTLKVLRIVISISVVKPDLLILMLKIVKRDYIVAEETLML